MGITRRQFLFSIPAAGAGLILPSFFDRAVEALARTGEPLLIPPDKCVTEMLAVDHGDGEYQLNIGDPWEGPPRLTQREYINRYYDGDVEMYVADHYEEGEVVDLDAQVDEWVVMDAWARSESPNAVAYHRLYGLDLGPDLAAANAAGELLFIDGPCPGNDYLGVHAADALTLSLLQQRLNQLDTGIHITVAC